MGICTKIGQNSSHQHARAPVVIYDVVSEHHVVIPTFEINSFTIRRWFNTTFVPEPRVIDEHILTVPQKTTR
jgi:hypothetical protein